MGKINWCFSIKNGLQKVDPNKNLSNSYLSQAENSLSKVDELIKENDLVWASVRIYYAAYYSLYAFLQRIGIKSENHDCSINLVKKLMNNEFVGNIDRLKKERIDAQYYLEIGKKEEMLNFYNIAKEFYLKFKNIIVNISDDDILKYRIKIDTLRK